MYESYNQQSLTIKGWSVTIGLAAIIAIYSQQIGRLGRAALWVASLSTIPFWLMDAYWKSFQNAYLDALVKLEAEPHCNVVNVPTLSLIGLWRKVWTLGFHRFALPSQCRAASRDHTGNRHLSCS
jgi:hypothetical protein